MAAGSLRSFYREDRSARPRLNIPLSRTEVLQDTLSMAGLFLGITAAILRPPGTSPGIYVLLPGALLVFVLITFVRRYPHRFNYLIPITEENADYQYRHAREFLGWLKTEVVWLFLGPQVMIELMAITTELAVVIAFLLVSTLGLIATHGTLLYYIFRMTAGNGKR